MRNGISPSDFVKQDPRIQERIERFLRLSYLARDVYWALAYLGADASYGRTTNLTELVRTISSCRLKKINRGRIREALYELAGADFAEIGDEYQTGKYRLYDIRLSLINDPWISREVRISIPSDVLVRMIDRSIGNHLRDFFAPAIGRLIN